jgi:hypothetical protein
LSSYFLHLTGLEKYDIFPSINKIVSMKLMVST